ncbi:MAG TPA: hypothetical protein VET88_09660, partial [Gammaproteobacteria bacterium]|nr:hypothetical protein [Gammaproteobacteria bacterium]
ASISLFSCSSNSACFIFVRVSMFFFGMAFRNFHGWLCAALLVLIVASCFVQPQYGITGDQDLAKNTAERKIDTSKIHGFAVPGDFRNRHFFQICWCIW